MSVTLFVDEGRQLITDLEQLLFTLSDLLKQPSTKISYRHMIQRDNPSIVDTLTGDLAHQAIADDICKLDYPDKLLPKFFICSAIQIPASYLPLITDINKAKLALEDWHARVLNTQPTKAEKQHYLRKVILNKCDRPLLNLDACDARLINIPDAITRITWNINHCRPSRRLSIQHAINELKEMAKNAEDEQSIRLDQEITALQSMKRSTPVAACYGRGVKVLRYRATTVNSEKELGKLNGHAANAIFYAGTHGQTPKFFPPDPQKTSSAGRPSTISDKIVTYSLPSWFFYKPGNQKTPIKKPSPLPSRTHNPIPGLRLGKRRGRICVIAGSTSISIRKYGLENAWAMAVDKLIETGKILPVDRDNALALRPSHIE